MTEKQTDRFHVQVLVREGHQHVWRRVRPTNGDPYVFTLDEARQYVKAHSIEHPGCYRTEALPPL
jgi:hypothetical protein